MLRFTLVPTVPLFGLSDVICGARIAWLTVKVRAPLVPPAVVTVTDREPVDALEAIITLQVTCVEVDWIPVTVIPLLDVKFTAVAPLRFVPAIVRLMVLPWVPLFGLSDVICGVGIARLTVKVRVPLVPPAVVTVTDREPVAALEAMATLQVTCVEVDWIPVTVIPLFDVKFTAVAPLRFVPVIVRLIVPPWVPLLGLSDVICGAGVIGLTVNVRKLLVPPAVTTVTDREPVAALEAIVTLQVTCVEVDWIPVTVIPLFDVKFTAVAPLRLVPVIVRFIVLPWMPLLGLSDVIEGQDTGATEGTTCGEIADKSDRVLVPKRAKPATPLSTVSII
jgi:hypothetical protein